MICILSYHVKINDLYNLSCQGTTIMKKIIFAASLSQAIGECLSAATYKVDEHHANARFGHRPLLH